MCHWAPVTSKVFRFFSKEGKPVQYLCRADSICKPFPASCHISSVDKGTTQPAHSAFLQHSWMPVALWQFTLCSLEPNPAEIPGRRAADPMAAHSWDWNSPILLKIHSLLPWEYLVWDFFFFLISFISHHWACDYSPSNPLSPSYQHALPNSSWDVISWDDEQLSSLYYCWRSCADKWKSECEPCWVSSSGGLEREADRFRNSKSWRLLILLSFVALGTGRCRERTHTLHCPGLAKSLWLPGWSQCCPTDGYTSSWHICKGIQCFLLGALSGFVCTLGCTPRIKKCAWHGCPKAALAENAARQWERKHRLKNY